MRRPYGWMPVDWLLLAFFIVAAAGFLLVVVEVADKDAKEKITAAGCKPGFVYVYRDKVCLSGYRP